MDWGTELDRRRAAVRAVLDDAGCDAALVFGSHGHAEHFRYLTNFAPVLGDAWLVMADGRESCVLDFSWQLEEARRRSGIDDWYGQLDAAAVVGDLLAQATPRRVGVAGFDRLPVTAFESVRKAVDTDFLDIGSAVAKLRRRKSALEVELLREAARLTDAGLDAARAETKEGATERDLAAKIGYALGAEWAFPPTVISGNDDPIPIREPTERALAAGDSVMVDIGAAFEGYQADASRTFVLGGPNQEQRRVWDAVRRAYDAALAATRPGNPCRLVHERASDAAAELGFELAHRIGHGIGLATSFEWPDLANEEAPLEPGVTICIEPGIAVRGAGVMKLEDDVVVTEDGFELLTHSDTSLT